MHSTYAKRQSEFCAMERLQSYCFLIYGRSIAKATVAIAERTLLAFKENGAINIQQLLIFGVIIGRESFRF